MKFNLTRVDIFSGHLLYSTYIDCLSDGRDQNIDTIEGEEGGTSLNVDGEGQNV